MSQKIYVQTAHSSKKRTQLNQSFERLNSTRAEIKQYLSGNFSPDKELEEAWVERYGSIG